MKTHQKRFLSAAVIAAALIATVAVARTVHTRLAAADMAPAQSALGAGPRAMAPLAPHGIVACGAMSYSDCEKIETLLPM